MLDNSTSRTAAAIAAAALIFLGFAGMFRAAGRSGNVVWHRQGSLFLRKREGLPSNFIHAIEYDNSGKLWVGTHSGLACRGNRGWTVFTGRHIEVSRRRPIWLEGNSPMPDNRVNDIVSFRDQMAVATDNGVGIFNPHSPDGGWVIVGTDKGLDSRYAHRLHYGGGALWIGTWGGGLVRYIPAMSKVTRIDPFSSARTGRTYVSAIAGRPDEDIIWAAYYKAGIFSYNGDSWRNITAESPLAGEVVRALASARVGIYAGADSGLYYYEHGSWREIELPSGGDTSLGRVLALDWNDNALAVGFEAGLAVKTGESWKVWGEEIDNARVSAVKLAESGVLWAGTWNHGLLRIER